ncbi:hypothetical protein SAMN04488090_3822 [Siphonobacter aquaeclarae]|uniref:Uncharacterized protein n=1 Tax=Siphonobacter aquaeclarae TaxID=563176 RepID=A0A1G9UHV8_9BACT|nr:hypothetical protein SAMN04488090_3822 [Siphonobacter aquaeclarae]
MPERKVFEQGFALFQKTIPALPLEICGKAGTVFENRGFTQKHSQLLKACSLLLTANTHIFLADKR